jgi:sugar lactone lactonase YvrE
MDTTFARIRAKGRRIVTAAVTAALAVSVVSTLAVANAAPAAADPAPPNHLVISEVNGDQSGLYRTNWVELYNPTGSAISLGTIDTSSTPATVSPNYYLCYASQAGTTCTSPYKLYGTILAHHYFLVEIYDAGTALPALPAGVTPDLNFASTDATVNPSQQAAKNIGGYVTGGQLLLLDASVDPTGAYPTAANFPGSAYSSTNRNLADGSINPSPVVDAMGFTPTSSAANLAGAEGWTSTTAVHSAPVQDASHWDERKFVNGVPQDTNDNAADFQISQRDPISQVSSQVAVASVSDATIGTSQPMTPITVAGSKGIGTLSYSATGLPGGISIDSGTGVISGTPAAADTLGAHTVTVTVTDQTPGTPDTATTTFTLTLSTALSVDPISNVSDNKGAAITPIQVQAHAGTPGYTYAATGLPIGVSIDSTGLISGTPTDAVGKYAVHVTVKDSGTGASQKTASTDFTLTELPALTGPGGSDPLAGLKINEVEATGTPADDFVELYNTGAAITGASVDLADSSGAVDHVTGLNVPAHGYAVINGSDLDAAGVDLAAKDTLYLSEAGGDAVLDQTTWTSYYATSWARYPDGTGDFVVSKQATKGTANPVPAALTQNDLVVAAVYGADGTTFNSDWVELYNPTDHDISLGSIDPTTGAVTPNYYQCYRANAGTTCSSMKLYGTVAPHHYFLIWNGHNTDATVDAHSKGVPPAGITPDLDFRYGSDDTNTAATKAANDPSGQTNNGFGGCNTGGQLWLLNASSNGVAPVGNLATPSAKATVVDGVGWTASGVTQPSGYETVGLSSGTNNACVIARNFEFGLPVDSDNNNADFSLADLSSFTLHSQASERVAITPVPDAEISLNEAMPAIDVKATPIFGALSFTASGLPNGITIDPGTGVISGTPDPADELTGYPVTVTVADGVASDTATISFTLTLSKELRLDPVADVSLAKGTALTAIDVKAHGGTSPYTYSATGLPAGVTLDPSTGVISGTPTDAVGRYAVHVTATDSGVGDAQASVSLDFTVVELPPLGAPAPGDPLAGLTLNEVRATGTPANDFVELFNTGSDLNGASLTLVDAEAHTYAVPTQDIAANGFVVVEGSVLDAAGFDLTASDTLYLTETDGTVLDQTSWTSYQATSWARTTDGTGTFAVSAFPTKGAPNSGAPVIHPNDLLVSEVNYDNNSTDWYEYSEVTNTTDHPIDFAAYGLTLTKSGAVMTLHDPSDTTQTSPTVDPVIPAHGTQLIWWVENQYFGVKTTAQFLANYGLPASTKVVLAYGFTSMANSGGDHSYYISVNHGATPISQAWVDTPCAANTVNGASVCTATNGNYAEHYEVPSDRTSPVAAVWYNSLHSGGDDINFALKAPLSSPGTVDLEQVGFTRAVTITSATGSAVTLHNTSSAAVDLSGYVLQKNAAGATYTLPSGTTVAAGADLVIASSDSDLTFGDDDYASLLAPRGYAYTDGIGLADTTGPSLHTLAYDASSGQPPVIDPTTGLPLPPAGGLYRPAGVSAQGGTVYASNTGDNVLAALANGANTILAGSLEGSGEAGDEGPATAATLYQPGSTAEDSKGNIFVADSGDNVIREITTDGTIHLFAGTGNTGGAAEAVTATSTPTTVNLWRPLGVAVNSAGDVFIADTFDNRVLEVSAAGVLSVVAGTGKASYTGDGAAATSATLSQPAGVAVDALDDLYIADSSNNVIRRVDASTGVITTVAGDYAADQANNLCLGGFLGDGGAATSAEVNDPQAIALDGAGDLFIADTFNNAVREVTPDGTITTVVNATAAPGAEKTSPTGSGAVPESTHLNTPYDLAIDPSTNVLYVADTHNNAIAAVSNAGHNGNASGPVESAAALAISSSTTATTACAVLENGPLVSTSAPTISGTPAVGSTLTAATGTWIPTPDSFSYQWLRDGVAIDGATQSTYAVTIEDVNHALSVAVTASKADFATATATSMASATVPVPSLTATIPAISGTSTVGSTLTAVTGTWTPTPDSFTYQWLRDGTPVSGATSSTYKLTSADAGHALSVTVTGVKADYTSASATSATVTVAGLPKTLTTVMPTISGTVKVGYTLTAKPGTWKAGTTTLPAADFTYQWLRNGKAISGGTRSTYALVAADKGTQVSVMVTGRFPGYTSASRTSASHTVAAGTLATRVPTISGTAKVGATLTAKPGVWKAGTVTLTGSHFTYQWYVNGQKIKGATRSTYKIASSYKGKRIAVIVTGSYPGYATASRTSASHTIAAGTLSTRVPTISGTAKVGKTLAAKPGVWKAGTATLRRANFTFQWYVNGKKIKGATRSTYKIASSYRGKRIAVIVKGTYPGYAAASRLSKATAAVKN